MGKKYKKKVQWKQLSLHDLLAPDTEKQTTDDCEEDEEKDSSLPTPTHENAPHSPRHPYKGAPFGNQRRGPHRQHGFYRSNYDRRFDDRCNNENFRNLEGSPRGGSGTFEKPQGKPFYERNYHYDKFYCRPPFYGERNFKFGPTGFGDRGRRPFRPYGRGFFHPRGFQGHFQGPFRDVHGKGINGCEGEEEDEEWDDEGILVAEAQQQYQQLGEGGERPCQPVHTVMINNEEYTKIQTPRQEVIFKKSSLDRKRDSIDQGSVTGSMTSGSGSSSCTGGEQGSVSAGTGDQVAGDGSSVAGSVEDTNLSVTGDDSPDGQHQDQVFEDPNEIFAGEPGGPPLAGVVMQQAYPGGPMITIPVHWTPFIDPNLIPGETALTPLDPAFTHVIDPKAIPIDPLHILPVQHDASGCPVHVQVKVDSNGVPIQIQPTAFTVSLSSLQQQQQEQQQQLQQDVLDQQQFHHHHHHHHQGEEQHHHLEEEGLLEDSQTEQPELRNSVHQEQENVVEDSQIEQPELRNSEHQDQESVLEDSQIEQPELRNSAHQDQESVLEDSQIEQPELRNSAHQDQESVLEDSQIEQPELRNSDHQDEESLLENSQVEQPELRDSTHQESEEPTDEEHCHPSSEHSCQEHHDGDEEVTPGKKNVCGNETGECNGVYEEEMLLVEEQAESDKRTKCGDENDGNLEESEESNTVVEMEVTKECEVTEMEEIVDEVKEKEVKEENDDLEEVEGQEEIETMDVEDETGMTNLSTENANPTTNEKETVVEDVTMVDVEAEIRSHEEVEMVVSIKEEEEEEEEEDDETVSEGAKVEEVTPNDTTSTSLVTSPPVPSKNSTEATTSSSSPIEARRNSEEEVEEEPEEEEDMLTKEAEESSDSNDSQYASMSESSSTPTTPAGEPSDAHEAIESHVVPCKAAPEVVPAHNTASSTSSDDVSSTSETNVESACASSQDDQETSHEGGVDKDQHPHTETTCKEETNNTQEQGEEDLSGEHQQQPEDASEKVLQGYVMVPILTPYYDPAVLYGYPVVVADQHPQHQQQRGYSKRKKKKYQRRRHADVPAAGGYLDPQLYTGEPFVATPGGYVVPVDASASVCQVHGFQFVNPPFHPHAQHPDEGFVQHSPYLQGVVPDLVAQQVQLFGGTNQDEGARQRIFSDLQEKERRQIEEILQEQRAKVGKSDSTESSDSGVSESEEAVAAELSSDERDANKPSQDALQSCENSEENVAIDNASTQCEEDTSDASQTILTEENSNGEVIVQEISNESDAQQDLSNGDSVRDESCIATIDQDQNSYDASIQQDPDSLKVCSDTPSEDAEAVIPNPSIKDNQNRFSSCDANLSGTEYKNQEDIDNSNEECDLRCNSSLEVAKDATENLDDLGNKSEFDFTEKEESTEVKSLSVQNSVEQEVLLNNTDGDLSLVQVTSSTSDSTTEEILSKQEDTQEIPSEAVCCQRINVNLVENVPAESSIDRKSLKDLKVTEAVKRWIREVTPEKAFFLSEVQTRFLEDEIQGEMDTEDEYIEDELPQTTQSTVRDPKNVVGNPFVAASSDATMAGMEGCSKRVAVSNRQRETTPDTFDDYDGSSTISNLSCGHLYSEASPSQPASFSHSFDEEEGGKYTENSNICNPVVYSKYYQLGIEVDDSSSTPTLPQSLQVSREATPVVQTESETLSECGSEDIETVPHKYDVVCQYTATSPMSLATEILKAEKVLNNMSHIDGSQQKIETGENNFGNPDIYLKHYGTALRTEVGDSGVQSEESSDEMESRSNVGSSGVGSSLASTPAISPAHQVTGRRPLQPHPLKNLSAGDGPVPCRTVCCAVM